MAPAGTIFARALPSEIRVEETYSYVALVRSMPHVEAPRAANATGTGRAGEEPAQAFIEVQVPYDGQQFFGEAAIEDVRPAVQAGAGLEDAEPVSVEAQIGQIFVKEYGRSNLKTKNGALAVRVPVLGDGVQGLEDLRRGRLEGRARFPYQPERPVPLPVHIEVRVSDEDGLLRQQLAVQEAEAAEDKDLKRINQLKRDLAEAMGQKAEFTPSLQIEFDVQLEVAAPIGVIDDPAPPLLQLLWLEWPGIVSYRRVTLFAENQRGDMEPHPIAYDPVTGRLQWGDLRFFPPRDMAPNRLYTYQAPRMELRVRGPAELLETTTLVGGLTVELPPLMSGLSFQYYDALGEHRQVPLKAKSVLQTALTIDVADCFDRRYFSPYHYVQFPGLMLDQMKLGDIVALLESMQFIIAGEPFEIEDSNAHPNGAVNYGYLVTAMRAEGASRLYLWLRAGGQSLHTERQRDGTNGDSHRTLRGSGDLTIALRSELDGSSRAAAQVLNKLHERLKQRFHFERVVK
jgi:hypothetical protein